MLINFFKQPSIVMTFSSRQWQVLINQGRISNLLGRCYFLLKKHQLISHVPSDVLWHFESAYKVANRQKLVTYNEIELINKALSQQNITPIFLKGAAYCILNLDCSHGRLFSDIDVLVSKNDLQKAETQFFINGWLRMEIDDYDDKYYRLWMHEIPPLRHCKRGTIVDLHHNLMPLTNKYALKIDLLSTQQTSNKWTTDQIKVLSNEEIIIHSSIHLFTEGEFDNGLRDISDLDMLLREFSSIDDKFIDKLITKANQLNLAHYLWLTLHFTSLLFNTPIHSSVKLNIKNKHKFKIAILDFCYLHAFKPNHSSCKTWLTPLAKICLYWRAHLIKMPLRLLIPHLIRKSWMSLKNTFTKETDPTENMMP